MATNGHSGYPLKWFVDQNAARDSWECAICLEVLKDPVQVRDCGHQFCALCIDDILKADPRCPSCRIEISKAMVFEDHAARRLIKKMDVNCCNEGCYWVGNLSSLLQTHMKSCKFLINVVSNDSGKQSDVEELKAKLESLATEMSKLNEMHKNDMEQADLQHQNELRRLALKHEADIKEMKIKHENDLKKHETDLKKVDGKRPRKPRRQGLAVPTDGQNNLQPQRTDSHEPRPYNVQGFNAQRRSQTRNRSVNRTENKELKKGDIGLPTNFQDGSHAGWDPRERFDINKLGDRWKIILSKAGVTDNDLKDPETLKFIADFLEKHDGVESFNAQNRELSPPGRSSDIHHHPPPPVRSYGTREGAPAPPPPIQGYSTPSPPPLFRGSSAPPPPPPSQRSSGSAPPLRGYSAAAAPPPPPSQQSAVPPPPRPPKPRRLSLRPPRLQFDDIQQHNHHPHHHFEEV